MSSIAYRDSARSLINYVQLDSTNSGHWKGLLFPLKTAACFHQ